MAFQAPTTAPRQILRSAINDSTSITTPRPRLEESQEWVLFSPSQIGSSTDRSSRTAGLSRASELESLQTAGRSRIESEVLDEYTEDGELDTLDDGLHAFQEPLYQTATNPSQGPMLPAHDGLGTFSSRPVLEQLWQHEQLNPKRKHDGHHRRASSIMRRLDTIDEQEAQANEEKRIRIEKWRLEQSQAMLEEVERETRRQVRRQSMHQGRSIARSEDLLGTTPKQSDYLRSAPADEVEDENEPFWRRLTRKFIRDIIGIDDPLLSVILGESLPEDESTHEPKSTSLATIHETPTDIALQADNTWRDRLLHRIARELGVCVHAISPHPGAFTAYTSTLAQIQSQAQTHDYAGLPVTLPRTQQHSTNPSINPTPAVLASQPTLSSALTPNFPPTAPNAHHAASWGFDDDAPGSSTPLSPTTSTDTLNLQREREFWERELDVRMVFRFLRERITGAAPLRDESRVIGGASTSLGTSPEAIGKRTAIIRQHHPLVARASANLTSSQRSGSGMRSPVRLRREIAVRRAESSCASESVKSSISVGARGRGRSGSAASSRNYWDLGGSVGSGSVLASGGLWGEA
jgi:hypothetical protein